MNRLSVNARGTFAACLVLAGLIGVAYGNSLLNEFVLDDVPIIASNPRIRTLESIVWLFGTDYWATRSDPRESRPDPVSELYRPLTLATYALNYALSGSNPISYHAVNLLLHFLVSSAVFLMGRQLMLGWTASLVAASLFAVHPIHTEAVSNVVGRAEILMSLGVLTTLWLAAKDYSWLALTTFAFAIFSKEQGVIALFLLPLYAYTRSALLRPARNERARLLSRGAWRPYVGYLVILAGYATLRLTALHGVPSPLTGPIENPIASVDWMTRVFTAIKVAGLYLRLCIWPGTLSADYSYNAIPVSTSAMEPGVLWGFVSWGMLIWVGSRSCRSSDRRACFAVGLTLFSFLPASNVLFPIGTIMGERLFYLPSAGLCLLVGLAYEHLLTRLRLRFRLREGSTLNLSLNLNLIVQIVLLMVCTALLVRTVIRNQDWRTPEALARSGIRDMPLSVKNHVGLVHLLVNKATPESREQAIEELKVITNILKDYSQKDPRVANDLAQIYITFGQREPAIRVYEDALAKYPNWVNGRYNLGLTLILAGRPEEAEPHLRKAIELKNDERDYYNLLSHVLLKQRRFEEALQAAEKTLELSPNFAAAHYYRAEALQGLGRSDEASRSHDRAEQLGN